MREYGLLAIRAVELSVDRDIDVKKAWEIASNEIFPSSSSSREKNCPKSAFLGLCEEGLVKGIAKGKYTTSIKNKQYALDGFAILKENISYKNDERALWDAVAVNVSYNQQMDVVLSLFSKGLLINNDIIDSHVRAKHEESFWEKIILFIKSLFSRGRIHTRVDKVMKESEGVCTCTEEKNEMEGDEMPSAIWNKLRDEISEAGEVGIDIHTINKNGQLGLWFNVQVSGDFIVIDRAETNLPSTKISQPRIIGREEFEQILELYEKWRSGTIARNILTDISMNTSYIFGIVNWFM